MPQVQRVLSCLSPLVMLIRSVIVKTPHSLSVLEGEEPFPVRRPAPHTLSGWRKPEQYQSITSVLWQSRHSGRDVAEAITHEKPGAFPQASWRARRKLKPDGAPVAISSRRRQGRNYRRAIERIPK